MPVLCELHVDLLGFMCEMSGSLNILLQMCFGSGRGDAGRVGRVSEAGRETDKDLASTSKLHPRCTRCPYLES